MAGRSAVPVSASLDRAERVTAGKSHESHIGEPVGLICGIACSYAGRSESSI